jgi:hypothetical protein
MVAAKNEGNMGAIGSPIVIGYIDSPEAALQRPSKRPSGGRGSS